MLLIMQSANFLPNIISNDAPYSRYRLMHNFIETDELFIYSTERRRNIFFEYYSRIKITSPPKWSLEFV